MFTMNIVFENGILQKKKCNIVLCLMQSSRLAVLSVVSFQNYVKYFISYQIEIYFASKYKESSTNKTYTWFVIAIFTFEFTNFWR